MVELVGGGSVINGAYTVLFLIDKNQPAHNLLKIVILKEKKKNTWPPCLVYILYLLHLLHASNMLLKFTTSI